MNFLSTVAVAVVVSLAVIVIMNTHCTDIFKPFGGDRVCAVRIP